MSRHPSVQSVVNFLKVNENLPEHLKSVSRRFEILRDDLLDDIKEDSPEVTAGFRKLLEAKDCFVRAAHEIHDQAEKAWSDVTSNGDQSPETD